MPNISAKTQGLLDYSGMRQLYGALLCADPLYVFVPLYVIPLIVELGLSQLYVVAVCDSILSGEKGMSDQVHRTETTCWPQLAPEPWNIKQMLALQVDISLALYISKPCYHTTFNYGQSIIN